MSRIDMKLKDMEQYLGTNPRPVDFDEYWDKAIAEMKAVDPQITMTKADFQAPGVECYDMHFTGVNGARIYAKHLRPKKIEGKIPAVVMFHGYCVNSGDWYDKLAYAMSGMAVFAMDVRGQGGKSEDVGGVHGNTVHGHIIRGLAEENPEKLLYRSIFLDTAQLAGIAMDMDFIDETKVYARGGSQGGGLTIACAALEPRIAKAVIEEPFLCDYRRVWNMGLDMNAYAELREYFRLYDPMHEHEEEMFVKLGYIDGQHLAPRIKAEVLMLTGLLDNVCPPSTQYAAYNKMTCKKKHLLYPEYYHEALARVNDIAFDFFVNGERQDEE